MTTHDKLLEAATALLDQSGPDGVTLRAVGALAGVSHNAPYKHFADKEGLLAAVAAHELLRHDATMREFAAAEPRALDRLQAMAKAHVEWAIRHPRRFRLIFGLWTRHDDGLHVAAGAAQHTLLDAVAAAQEAGLIRDDAPEQTAALLMAAAHGAVDMFLSGHLSLDGKSGATPELLVLALIELLRDGSSSGRQRP